VMIGTITGEIRQQAPEQGDVLADLVVTIVRGLSAAAFTGMDPARLRAAAEKAGAMFKGTFPTVPGA